MLLMLLLLVWVGSLTLVFVVVSFDCAVVVFFGNVNDVSGFRLHYSNWDASDLLYSQVCWLIVGLFLDPLWGFDLAVGYAVFAVFHEM